MAVTLRQRSWSTISTKRGVVASRVHPPCPRRGLPSSARRAAIVGQQESTVRPEAPMPSGAAALSGRDAARLRDTGPSSAANRARSACFRKVIEVRHHQHPGGASAQRHQPVPRARRRVVAAQPGDQHRRRTCSRANLRAQTALDRLPRILYRGKVALTPTRFPLHRHRGLTRVYLAMLLTIAVEVAAGTSWLRVIGPARGTAAPRCPTPQEPADEADD